MTLKSKILQAFLLASGLGIIVAIIFVIVTLNQIPLAEVKAVLTRSITKSDQTDGHNQQSKLEAGALLKFSDLKTFTHLSQSPSAYYDNSMFDVLLGDVVALKEEIIVDPPAKNDCQEIYCVQLRRPFREVPSVLWRGLIGIEDIRFLGHVGFDVRAIARAIVRDVISMGFVEGGSTITQQLAKNLFLSSEKSIWRKLKELVVAVAIEIKFEKDEIIQAYLNEVYWGVLQGVRVKGFHAASELYFKKLPRDLEEYEAAILVSLLKGPGFYHPLRHLDRLQQRVATVVQSLIDKNVLDGDIEIWNEKKWQKWKRQLELDEDKASRPVYAWWLSQSRTGGPIDPYGQFVFTQASQKILAQSMQKAPETDLAVKALVIPWRNAEKVENFEYYSKVERDTKVAINEERHQVGSTLKPLIYASLIRLGNSLDRPVETAAIELNLKSGKWSPQESHHVPEEYISLAEALKQSLNRPIIRLAQEVGFDRLENHLSHIIPDLLSPLSEYPAQLLGAVELTVAQLAQSYRQFFNQECSESGSGIIQVLDDPNQTTIKRVVGKVMSQMRFFGKTGTTNGGRDNWFVFFDGKIISAIWVGQETKRSGKDLPLYGSSTAFRILEHYLLYRGKLFNDLHCAPSSATDIPMDTAI
tara:strand:- start:18 stop:1940 length:1923 start_codon:yes stop_codon:yes gene_type:complete